MKKIISTDKAPAAVGTYSQGVEYNGVYYFSGQIGINPTDGVLAEGFEAQMDQILKNIDGISLKPLIEGKPQDELPVYMQSTPMLKLKSHDFIGIRTSKYKYFRDKENSTIHLYDLVDDPHEDHNIAETNVDMVKKLESTLQRIFKETPVSESTDERKKRIEEEYKKLGYL